MPAPNETETRYATGANAENGGFYPAGEPLHRGPPTWEYREFDGRLRIGPRFLDLFTLPSERRELRQALAHDLNLLGSKGWELVCVVGERYLFKRQRREEATG